MRLQECQLGLCLKCSQRCTQLMCGISDKRLLCLAGFIQPAKQLIECGDQWLHFAGYVGCIQWSKIIKSAISELCAKVLQRAQGMAYRDQHDPGSGQAQDQNQYQCGN